MEDVEQEPGQHITAMATYPGTNAAMVAFEGVGATRPSGHSEK
jgi:hypothetical protein